MKKEKIQETPQVDDRFTKAVEILLAHEGGYVNDPDDTGGETNWGISKRSYPDLDIKNLTKEDATQIYRKDWWEKYKYSEIKDDRIAFMLFNLAVNMGPVRAHRFMQAALRKDLGFLDVAVDGVLGPKTIAAINQADPNALIRAFGERCEIYYRAINKPSFLAGWLNRLHSFMEV